MSSESAFLSRATLSSLAAQLAQVASELGVVASAVGSLSPPLAEAVNEFVACKARADRSDRYVRQLRVPLRSLARGREGVRVEALRVADVEAWLHAQPWSNRTKRGALLDVRNFLAWCVRRGWIAGNVAAAVDVPRSVPPAVRVHRAPEVAEVLRIAYGRDKGLGRLMALRYFTGVRSAEACRLCEVNLLMAGHRGGFLEVPAAAAKTRARRLVPLPGNLGEWLRLGGTVPVGDFGTRFRFLVDAVEAAGIAMPKNVTRHSWCSARLASTGDAATTALEAGHSEAMLFRHYRAVVSPAEAEAYFSVVP